MTVSRFNDSSHFIIGAYYEVYNHTSRTFPEYIYEQAMIEELRLRGVLVTSQDKYRIMYKGHLVGLQQLDLFIANDLVSEIKVVDQITRLHKAQCISYIKTVDKRTGLLFNFGGQEPEFNRLYFDPAKRPTKLPQPDGVTPPGDWLYPDLAYQIVGGLHEVHRELGAGFVYRIYANACHYELRLRGLAIKSAKRIQVAYKDRIIGDVAFANILVEGKIMLFPIAIGKVQDIHLDNLKQWMELCGVRLGILANFDAVSLEIVFVRI